MENAMKTRVDFYLLPTSTLDEAFRYACRLAEKSYLSKQSTFIWMNSKEEADRINGILWTFRDISFVPHRVVTETHTSPPEAEVPVQIGFKNTPCSSDVLINLTQGIPSFILTNIGNTQSESTHPHWKRVIELVSDEPSALTESRKKYRIYTKNDCELVSHDLKKQTA